MSSISTSVTLLEKLRQPGDQAAWHKFVKLYTPLLLYWGRKRGLSADDAQELTQDVMTLLVQKLPTFQYNAARSFRGWLRQVLLNKLHEQRRRKRPTTLEGHEEEVPVDAEEFWESEYRDMLVARALDVMSTEFEERTWRACWLTTVEGRTVAEASRELQMQPGAIYVAKGRVLKRLREELAGLWD